MKRDRGVLRIDGNECKGWDSSKPVAKVISMREQLNHYGYKTAVYAGKGCTGCGICSMICPEPGAITVYRLVNERDVETQPVKVAVEGATECASN